MAITADNPRDPATLPRRLGAAAIALGALLMAGTTAVHPPIFDPAAGDAVAHAVRQAPLFWSWLHWLAAAGFLLWRLGFMALHLFVTVRARPLASTVALGLSWMAGSLWLGLLVFEAAAFPRLAAAPAMAPDLFASLWAAVILTGFLATAVDGLASALWGAALLAADAEAGADRARTGWAGVAAGSLLITAAVIAPLAPGAGVMALAVAGLGFLLWSYQTAALLWKA